MHPLEDRPNRDSGPAPPAPLELSQNPRDTVD